MTVMKSKVRRLSVVLLVIQLIAAGALAAVVVMLMRTTILADDIPRGRSAALFITLRDEHGAVDNGDDSAERLDVRVVQETSIDGELSTTFSVFSDASDPLYAAEKTVEVVFVSRSPIDDLRCLNNSGEFVDLGVVPGHRLSTGARRTFEVMAGEENGLSYPDVDSLEPEAEARRDRFWTLWHAYRFTTTLQLKSGGDPGPNDRSSIDGGLKRHREFLEWTRKVGTKTPPLSGFYCTESAQSVWKTTRTAGFLSYAPYTVTLIKQALPGLPDESPDLTDTLFAQTSVSRDPNYFLISKPDDVQSTTGQWLYIPPVSSNHLRAWAGNDYFIFEQKGRDSRYARDSFWLGLAVAFLVITLPAIGLTIFRMATGRVSYYGLVDDWH